MLANLVEAYGIKLEPEPEYHEPSDPELAYMITGYSECIDSFFAFGLFALAERSGIFPPELVETFEPVMQEECRHILLFANWLAWHRRRMPLWRRPWFEARVAAVWVFLGLERTHLYRKLKQLNIRFARTMLQLKPQMPAGAAIPRVLPDGVAAERDLSAWSVPAVFGFLQRTGNLDDHELLRTFNSGIGMVAIVSAAEVGAVVAGLERGARQAGQRGRERGFVQAVALLQLADLLGGFLLRRGGRGLGLARLLDHAQNTRVAARVTAQRARVGLAEVAARRAEADALAHGTDRIGQPQRVLFGDAQQMQRQTLCALQPDARQLLELGDEQLQVLGGVHGGGVAIRTAG